MIWYEDVRRVVVDLEIYIFFVKVVVLSDLCGICCLLLNFDVFVYMLFRIVFEWMLKIVCFVCFVVLFRDYVIVEL